MASKIEIVNLALIKLDAKTIEDLTENNNQAITMNAIYDPIRQAVLESHPWNFAMTGESLTATTDTDPLGEFDVIYKVPADYLRGVSLFDSKDRWKVKGNKVFTDASPAKLLYIKDVEDTGLFSPLFVEALATRLAAEAAPAISRGSAQQKAELLGEFKQKMQEAKMRDSQEGTPDNIIADTWTDSRGHSFSWID